MSSTGITTLCERTDSWMTQTRRKYLRARTPRRLSLSSSPSPCLRRRCLLLAVGFSTPPEEDNSAHSALVDKPHLGYLRFALVNTLLVNADGINPDGPDASLRPKKAKQCCAVPRLEQDIPVAAHVYGLAKTRITSFISPGV